MMIIQWNEMRTLEKNNNWEHKLIVHFVCVFVCVIVKLKKLHGRATFFFLAHINKYMNWMQIFFTEKNLKNENNKWPKKYISTNLVVYYISIHIWNVPDSTFLFFFVVKFDWIFCLFVTRKIKFFFQTITCHSVDIGSPSNIHINILNVYAYLNLEERPFPVDVNNFTTRVFMVINRIFHILCNYYHHHRSHKNVWHSFFNENNKNEWPDFFCLLIFG